MKRIGKIIVFLVVALLAAVTACQSGSMPHVGQVETEAPEKSPLNTPLRIVTDDLERRITVPTKISRAVSLAPSVTEMIFAAGGGDRLVGVTTFCNYPEEAKLIAKIGDTMNPNMESIVALKPDVVFVSTASQIEAFTKTLEANGIAVYVTNPNDLGGILRDLKQLGDIFGTNEQTEKIIRNLESTMVDLSIKLGTQLIKQERVFVQISKEPLFTIGKDSFLNEIVRNAGGESVTINIETAYPKLSKETALALNPDVIILSQSDDNLEPNEVFTNSPAVKKGRVYSVNADLLSRPGPRVFDAMEQIARDLHPEKFK